MADSVEAIELARAYISGFKMPSGITIQKAGTYNVSDGENHYVLECQEGDIISVNGSLQLEEISTISVVDIVDSLPESNYLPIWI